MEFALQRRCRVLGLGWIVSSAGTLAQPGLPAHPYARQLLLEHGDDDGYWRSRQPNRELVESSDLLLTATLENRSQVLREWPQAAGRTFPLLQLAELWAQRPTGPPGDDGSRAAMLQRVTEARGRLPPVALWRDLPDPMGRSWRTFRRVDRQIESAMDDLVSSWDGATGARTTGRGGQRH